MDCVNARLLLTLAGRNLGELDPPDRDSLHGHLKACSTCAARAQDDVAFDDAIRPALLAVPLPLGLKSQLLARLSKRRWRPVPWVAAAILLIGIGLGGLVWTKMMPQVVELRAFSDVVSFDNYSPGRAAEWFASIGLGDDFAFPPHLQAEYLQAYDAPEFQGKRVPRLVFSAPADGNHRAVTAYVYVLSRRRFRFEAGGPVIYDASTHTAEVEQGPDFAFVAVYPQGTTLHSLLVRPAL